jgi:hypothetical protein
MAKQSLNLGSAPNDGTGSNLRDGGDLINDNFNEIYNAIGNGTTITAGTFLTTTNSEIVTNKTISGLNNTLSNIGNGSLTNPFITLIDDTSTTQSISLGNSFRFIGGSGITTAISGNTITFDTDGSIVTEASTSVLTNKNLSSLTNTFPTITLIDDTSTTQSISLGDSFRFIGGSGITTAISGNTITFDTDGSIVTEASTSVLTNKNLSSLTNTFPTITLIDDTSTTDDVSLGETLRLTGGTGITSVVGSNEVTFNIDSTVATLTGTQELTNKTINASSNTVSNIVNANLSGSAAIANANLANPSITLGVDTIDLGATQTTITNLNLDGTSSLSGTGTIDLTGSGSRARFNFAGFGALPAFATYEGMFAYDTVGDIPYYADTGGWVRILDENSSVSAHADVNISGIADGYILKWSSAQARFNAEIDGGGGTVTSIIAGTGLSGGTITTSGTIDIQNDIPQNLYIDVIGTKYNADASNTYHTIVTTVATKTTAHIYYGTGSTLGYKLDGIESPFLNLKVGNTYRFDQADASNSTHQILFYYDAAKVTQYTAGVTTNGTAGTAGAYTQIVVSSSTPNILFYQCVNHGYMGNRADLDTSNFIAPTFTGVTGSAINYGTGTVTSIIAGTGLSGGTVTTSGTILVDTSSIFQGAATIDVTASGSAAYLFNSHYSGNNPTLYLRAGHTYALNLAVTGHPFHLQTVSGGYSAGNPYTTGLTHVATNGTVTTGASALLKVTGVLYIEVPSGSSSTIYYACQYHGGMVGKIVLGPITDTFTGDGTTVGFTINSGRNVNDVLAIVNGIILVPTTDYTISGTTITFQVAPAASAEIQVRYL